MQMRALKTDLSSQNENATPLGHRTHVQAPVVPKHFKCQANRISFAPAMAGREPNEASYFSTQHEQTYRDHLTPS